MMFLFIKDPFRLYLPHPEEIFSDRS